MTSQTFPKNLFFETIPECIFRFFEKYLSLSYCSKAFLSPDLVKKHVKNVHEGVRDHKCILCTRAFFRSCHLKRHIERIHGDYITNFKNEMIGQYNIKDELEFKSDIDIEGDIECNSLISKNENSTESEISEDDFYNSCEEIEIKEEIVENDHVYSKIIKAEIYCY